MVICPHCYLQCDESKVGKNFICPRCKHRIVGNHLIGFIFYLNYTYKQHSAYSAILRAIVQSYVSLNGLFLMSKHALRSSQFLCINGYKMYSIPNDEGISKDLIIFKSHEKTASMQLCKELKSGMICLDIGSNIGYYALLERVSIGRNGKVIAIEPSPIAYAYLKKNIALNNLGSIEAFQLAISDKDGHVPFLINKRSNVSRVLPGLSAHCNDRVIYVKSNTLDSFVKDNRIIKLRPNKNGC